MTSGNAVVRRAVLRALRPVPPNRAWRVVVHGVPKPIGLIRSSDHAGRPPEWHGSARVEVAVDFASGCAGKRFAVIDLPTGFSGDAVGVMADVRAINHADLSPTRTIAMIEGSKIRLGTFAPGCGVGDGSFDVRDADGSFDFGERDFEVSLSAIADSGDLVPAPGPPLKIHLGGPQGGSLGADFPRGTTGKPDREY